MSVRRRSVAGAVVAVVTALVVTACSPGVPVEVDPGASGLLRDIKT